MREPDSISLKAAIFVLFQEVAREQHRPIVALHDSMALNDTGLDSLCFAVVVARLEDALGVDPFSISEDGPFPTTVGEFVALYERAI